MQERESGVRSGSCVDGPRLARDLFARVARWSLAVMCPALLARPRPQALMGTVDRDLIKLTGSRCPLTQRRSLSIRRLTDDAITRLPLRKLSEPAGGGRSGRR